MALSIVDCLVATMVWKNLSISIGSARSVADRLSKPTGGALSGRTLQWEIGKTLTVQVAPILP
jgi:hypothetical protein